MLNNRHLTNVRDLRDHYNANMCEWAFEAPGEPITLRMKWITLRGVIADRLRATACEFLGHDYTPDGCDYVESGGEGFTCNRCGHGFTAWH